MSTEQIVRRHVANPAEGRRLVAETLVGQCPAAIDTARLLVSELVTNALLHARSPQAEVTIRVADGHAHLAVSDNSPDLPQRPPLDPSTVGGFGMHIVDDLSHTWGVTPTGHGKTVWVELGCDHPATD